MQSYACPDALSMIGIENIVVFKALISGNQEIMCWGPTDFGSGIWMIFLLFRSFITADKHNFGLEFVAVSFSFVAYFRTIIVYCGK